MGAEILQRRASGLLLPLFSLPSLQGIGDLGTAATQFLDFLEQSGQSYWQMLPVTPAGAGNSPYQSLSAFATDPLYLNLEELAEEGLLTASALAYESSKEDQIDYTAIEAFKGKLLREAFNQVEAQGGADGLDGMAQFHGREKEWLDPWCLYISLKEDQGMKGWMQWPQELQNPHSEAVAAASQRLAGEIRFQRWLQFRLQKQWDRLKQEANRRGIALVGDIPIFVSMDSADAWARQDLFRFDRVAGVPPDYFSEDGQVWGNPVYHWDKHRDEGYHWWKQRFRRLLGMFDVARVDHFIGFQRTWSIPQGAKSAKDGAYEPGPSYDFFHKVEAELGKLAIIAEDLGVLTEEVEALRDQFEYPGMKVLQFAFGAGSKSESEQPHNYRRNLAAYTGTHDNNTSEGWFEDAAKLPKEAFDDRAYALKYIDGTRSSAAWDMVRAVFASPANTAIAPVQDLLGLGGKARVNTPGTATGNWRWRLSKGSLGKEQAAALLEITALYGRLTREL